ncbi:carbohydrate sulfotransferase 11-like isoform X2 [Pomacea canaliculata]|uniref:carbohydrate sulfotransferase 11-like isoform X2 n=1 Tax=Pomacea canaliculata TaxID=400727 RepID=UPI000D72D072|nr:carbohydrate sulfotransferase 11-like isoform X2 [Pomacea canaliculata]
MRVVKMVSRHKLCGLLVLGGAGPLALFLYILAWAQNYSATTEGLRSVHKHLDGLSDTGNHTLYLAQTDRMTQSSQGVLGQHIRHMCHKLKMLSDKRNITNPAIFDHILVDDRFKVLYCQVPKVACSNWRRVFLYLSGKVKAGSLLDLKLSDVHGAYDQHLTYLSDLTPEQIHYRLDNYYKFVFVREPFERLLSAYRNKLVGQTSTAQYFKEKFGRFIIKRFRDKPLAASVKDRMSRDLVDETDVRFTEFLHYLADRSRQVPLNEHWAQYIHLCHPCVLQYDFIGKYENLDADAQYVLRAIHADHLVTFPARGTTYRHNRTADYLSHYYGDVHPSLLRRIYRLYQPDFLLFNYSVPSNMQQLMDRT